MLDRLQRRSLQPSGAPARSSKSKGHRFRTSSRHRGDSPRVRGIRSGLRRSARGHVCLRRSTTAAGASCSPRATAWARSRSSTRVLDGTLHFASELPALAHAPWWDGDIDLTALEGYLSLGYFLAPSTIYRNVSKLLPAHWLRVANGRVETAAVLGRAGVRHRPAARSSAPRSTSTRRCAPRCSERLESEVPLGAFLSGGIDSGLVVSYMAEALGDRLVTTSVGFGDAAHNELDAAALTATHFRQPSLCRGHRAEPGRGRRARHGPPGRTAGRFVGHSHVVCVAGGEAARNRGAQRGRRGRELRRIRLPIRASRHRSIGAPVDAPRAGPRRGLAGRALAAIARTCHGRCAPERCSRTSAATRRRAYYADLAFLKPATRAP